MPVARRVLLRQSWQLAELVGVVGILAACGATATNGSSAAPASPSSASPTAKVTAAPAAKPSVSASSPVLAKSSAATGTVGRPSGGANVVSIKVGSFGSPSDAGVYVALDRDYFAAEGIKVELVHFSSGPQIAPALGTERLQAGGGAVSPVFFNLALHRVPIKIVADKGKLLPGFGYEGLMVRQDLIDSGAIKSVSDLKGKTIAYSGTHFLVDIALKKVGLSDKDVQWKELGFPDMVVALGNKAIDAAMYLEPFGVRAEQKKVATRWLRGDKIDPGHQMGVLFFSPKMAQNTNVAQRFVTAYIKGVRDYDAAFVNGKDKAGIIKILTRHASAKDPALYDQMTPPGLDPNGSLNVRSLQEDYNWYLDNGLLKQKMDVSKIVDTTFLDYALKVLGKR
ncbi:MAG: ABC transporter substrate-binding protein [Chloroflexota bacterium]